MSADGYLRSVISKYSGNPALAKSAARDLQPVINRWGGTSLLATTFSGSIAKGTAIKLGSDADLFLSLSSVTPNTLQVIYDTLFNAFSIAGFVPRRQNVSIGVTHRGCKIDLVPGRRQSQFGNIHSLYNRKSGTWIQTDVSAHINKIAGSGRLDEIRLVKIWRHLHNINFRSFYLELAVMRALLGLRIGNLDNNLQRVFEFLAKSIIAEVFIDPANTNNRISDDLDLNEKLAIATAALMAANSDTWANVVW